MYARCKFCRLTGTRTEAELLGELCTSLAILLQGTPDSLEDVRGLFRRIGGLPHKAALRFCCEGRSVLLCGSERSMFPLTVITPRGPGILSLRYA